MLFARFNRALPRFAALALLFLASARPVYAQALAAVVNGDPITTTEVDEQMKFRRILHQSAGRSEALEDLIGDRLKLRQANREGVDASDAGFAQVLDRLGKQAGMSSQQLLGALQQAKVNIDLVRSHIRALAAWNDFVKARYKALNVSQQEIDAALAKDTGARDAATDYTLQQIVLVLPVNATAGTVEQRMREAQALRSRFLDCPSGIPLARALPDVAVKPPINRTAGALSATTRKAIEQIQRGRLTTPDRTASGIEMIAVCGRDDDNNTTSVREGVQANLLVERLSKESDKLYQDLRSRAVVDKR